MSKKFLLRFSVLSMLLLVCLPLYAVNASEGDGLHVIIEWPNEGETLYAGPTSLLYKVPIKGRVESDEYNPTELTVQLEVFRGGQSIGALTHTPDKDGSYQFYVTVNPEGSLQEFTIGFRDCGELCHSEGEMALQPGRLEVKVTAIAPDGRRRSTRRQITVDVSQLATVPVDVFLEDEPEQSIAGVKITASTWLYLWRSRFGSGVSDESGRASVNVEALTQAPTDYHFRVSPTIVDGVLYRGVESASLTLLPGAAEAPPIRLAVTAHRASIQGKLISSGATDSVDSVWAICLPDGHALKAGVNAEGRFTFTDIPVDQYYVTLDLQHLIARQQQAQGQHLDLTTDLAGDVTLNVSERSDNIVRGRVEDGQGQPLPFAWAAPAPAASEEPNVAGSVEPRTGRFILPGLADDTTLIANAPGYYARAVVVNTSSQHNPVVRLQPRPETEFLPWGQGALVLPADSEVERDGRTLTLRRGWLWGSGRSERPYTIQIPGASLTIAQGDFALVYRPGGNAWLYLFEGAAELINAATEETIPVHADEMVNLLNDEGLKVVAYDPVVISALRTQQRSETPLPVWQPSLSARIRDGLARLGVGTAQVVTFVTYILVLSSLLALPALIIYWIRKSKRES